MRGYNGYGLFNYRISPTNDLLLGNDKSSFMSQAINTAGSDNGPYANMMLNTDKRVPTGIENRPIVFAVSSLIRIA